MTAATALREFADDQLLDQLNEMKHELFNLRFQFATGQLEDESLKSNETSPALTRSSENERSQLQRQQRWRTTDE